MKVQLQKRGVKMQILMGMLMGAFLTLMAMTYIIARVQTVKAEEEKRGRNKNVQI